MSLQSCTDDFSISAETCDWIKQEIKITCTTSFHKFSGKMVNFAKIISTEVSNFVIPEKVMDSI